MHKALASLGRIALAGGGAVMMSAPTLPPVETNPEVIAAALNACDAGDAEQCYVYATAILGKKTKSEGEMAIAYRTLERACKGNVKMACYEAGLPFITGVTGKVNLKQARKYEAMGCVGGDERACTAQSYLDNPPPTAANLTKLPPVLQGKVNLALYIAPKGGELIFLQARLETSGVDQQIQADMYEASCDMGYAAGCASAATMYATPPTPIKTEKPITKNMARALTIARKGCAKDDGMSCYLTGVLIKIDSGNYTDEAHAAYRKSISYLKQECDKKNGRQCWMLADIYRYGISKQYDLSLAAQYYQKACDYNYQAGCQGLGEVKESMANLEADRQRLAKNERDQKNRQEQQRQARTNPALQSQPLSQRCADLSDRAVNEVSSMQRRLQGVVDYADKNWNTIANPNANYYKAMDIGNQSCLNLLGIARQMDANQCPAELRNTVLKGIPRLYSQFGYSNQCYKQSREMGANWNTNSPNY